MTEKIQLSKINLNNGQLKGVPKNPRFIRDDKFEHLKKSIEEDPEMIELRELIIVPFEEKYVCIAGNMRLRALRELGYKEAPCKVIDYDDKKLRAIATKDNMPYGDWDWDLITNEWDTAELEEWGFEFPEDIEEEQVHLEAAEDDYQEPENIQVDVELGDLIEIGEHRLLCGDSTDSDQVAKLMNGEKADMVFTDPPYDCSAGGRNTEFYKMDVAKGKEIEKFGDKQFNMDSFLPNLFLIQKANTNNIVFTGTYTLWSQAMPFFHENFDVAGIGIWSKPFAVSNVRGVGFAKSYEPFVYSWNKPHTFNPAKGVENYDVIHMASNAGGRSYNHPTSKPLKLVGHLLRILSNEKELITDLFLGSGSTMVAAHQLKRKCYGMELDPKYCQVIIDRMKKLDPNIEIKINGKKYEPKEKEE